MNKLILTGRPTKDPDIIYSNEGERATAIARFTIAANRIFAREGEARADFIPCVAFGRTAKLIEEYVKKGMLLLVTGQLQNNDYTNKDGVKVYGFQMKVDSVELLEKKEQKKMDEDGFMKMDEMNEEMPFNQEM